MTTDAKLSFADREFLKVVAETAFCNPFSEQRPELDAKIVGRPVEPGSEDHLEEMTRAVSARLQAVEDRGHADLRRYSGADRELMRTVFLFEIFHQFCQSFDQLILDQVKLGAQSVPVKFADEALTRMRRRGIVAAEAARYFSIFYQLRRAYHFIVRGLIGRSPCMRELRRHLWNNVFTRDVPLYERYLWNRLEDFSTLLLGETGSGKGAAAAAIGRSGYIPFDEKQGRFAESFMRGFIALNLSQFPEALIESELFGHRKGAFTGAVEAHEGLLARCSPHGAIFLDEIGEVSAPIQIKLLQVLQERTFCPVGSHEAVRFRGRVIAATNRPLETLRGRGLFRDDFFYRLCSDMILVPPLRQRLQEDPEELHRLLDHAVTRIIGEPATELTRQIEETIRRTVGEKYPWPGNVRELEQAVRRILLTGDYAGSATPKSRDLVERLVHGIETEALDADGLLSGYCALLYEHSGNYEAVARQANLDPRTVKKYLRQNQQPAVAESRS
ncbi:MAG: sigma 54-interacting transcriptional regulator [Verrucomicrobia bacterium]|nr:sigma 54-interacting transcriptional regulator [Verrucomicrobiota bacterium]